MKLGKPRDSAQIIRNMHGLACNAPGVTAQSGPLARQPGCGHARKKIDKALC
jgi:hypothetical protein